MLLYKPYRRMVFRFTSVLFACMLLFSCNSGDHCYESSDSLMVTSFIGNKETKIESILVKGYNRNGIGDTLAFSNISASTVKVGLPLSLAVDSTGFVVSANGKTSTFWLKYSMDLQLISNSCGFAPYYSLIATRHSSLIDSVRVSDKSVDPKSVERYATNGQNITIYLHLTTP